MSYTCCCCCCCFCCQAGAAAHGIPLYQHIANLAGNPHPVLPVPSFNVINGGVHAGNSLAPQEFMILPVGCVGRRGDISCPQAMSSNMIAYIY